LTTIAVMRAVIADHAGGPEVLRPETLPDPLPGHGQVRIVVEVSAITFVDVQRRAGLAIGPPVSFPVVLGNGVGGRIDRVGDDVDPAWIGVSVVSSTGGTGGYATLALASVGDLHRLPAGLGLREATALLADGRTAVGLHRVAGIRPGESVVVTAAAGGVGSLLVQLASAAGGRVIGLAGSAHKLDRARARALGVGTALDYRDGAWVDGVRDVAPEGVDVVFDGIGGDVTDALFPLVRPGGRYVQHGAASGRFGAIDAGTAQARGVILHSLGSLGTSPEALFALAEEALALGARSLLHPTIGQTFPLERAADAHAAIEARTAVGKTLLIP
jgi:NADPH2:quinone reductase